MKKKESLFISGMNKLFIINPDIAWEKLKKRYLEIEEKYYVQTEYLQKLLKETSNSNLKVEEIYKIKNNEKKSFAVNMKKEKFYNSTTWLSLRYIFLSKNKKICMVCKKSDSSAEFHVDHILPISIYPEKALDESNLQILCKECNLGKGKKLFAKNKKYILKKNGKISKG